MTATSPLSSSAKRLSDVGVPDPGKHKEKCPSLARKRWLVPTTYGCRASPKEPWVPTSKWVPLLSKS